MSVCSHQHHNEISSRVKIHLMPSFCANFTFCSISARDSSVWQEETAKLFFFLHFYVHIGFMVQIRGHRIMFCKDLFFICTCLHLWIKMIWIFKLLLLFVVCFSNDSKTNFSSKCYSVFLIQFTNSSELDVK